MRVLIVEQSFVSLADIELVFKKKKNKKKKIKKKIKKINKQRHLELV